MTRRRVTTLGICAALALGTGCGTSEPAALREGAHEAGAAQREEALAPSTRDAPTASSMPSVDRRDEVILDVRADGARLSGRVLPVPLDADPERAVLLRIEAAPEILEALGAADLNGARVLDARFAGDAIVTIGVDHVLRAHARDGVAELDRGAYGPLSVAGTQVAYVRGQAPLLELARADVATAVAIQLTHGMAPAWSPTLTPDGRSIVFVSGVLGTPRLHRVDGDGAPRALAETTRTPGSPTPPRFEDGLLVFEDELGTAWVDVERGDVVRSTERGR